MSSIPGVEFEPRMYVGVDAGTNLLDSLQNDLDTHIKPWIEGNVEMIWDEDTQKTFDTATHCHICEEKLQLPIHHCHNDGESDETCTLCAGKPVRDHDHFTGSFRGAAHNSCNLQYGIDPKKYKLPIFFHNLRGYDSHLIFQKVQQKHGHIDVIANNSERYISFTIGKLKFLDSMQFLSGSLDKLSAQLKPEQFFHFKKCYPKDDERKLLTKKGVYPYSYMNCMERFEETSLPDDDAFYDNLQNKPITKKQRQHADKIR